MNVEEQRAFVDEIQRMSDQALQAVAEKHIWRWFVETPLPDNGWKCKAVYQEAERRKRPELYQRAAKAVSRRLLTQVRAIRNSNQFRKSAVLCRLLTYVVKATIRGEKVKEIELGISALGKEDYNPQSGGVRAEVRRLRDALQTYYETAGANDNALDRDP